jgi:hypothetical protein
VREHATGLAASASLLFMLSLLLMFYWLARVRGKSANSEF